MINNDVIKEIYKKFGKPKKGRDLRLPYFLELLQPVHSISDFEDRIIVEDLEEFNPFRMFLKRNINAILEFDKEIAFVFRSHILFFNRESKDIRIHIRLEEKKSFLQRLFGK